MINVTHLTKTYKIYQKENNFFIDTFKRKYFDKNAVNDISFNIEQGELIGFLGPNGAGKTTTLKMLSGILYPTKGDIQVLGFKPWERKKEFLKQIALVMGQKEQVLADLPPLDSFDIRRIIYDIPKDEYNAQLTELVELMDAKEIVKRITKTLSLGEKMKCEIIMALLHRPKIIFLMSQP